ncbi:MAG TPA: CheR family methyltransferase [Anaerolineales bacterium]|nr:CheR family methyltransferase [Anaerolineales bacterium]
MTSNDSTEKSQTSPRPTKQPRKIEAETPVEPSSRKQDLTVVGIGASAGGLEALRTFFSALSPDTGMAFVVVTHLHPEHESHLAELLQKYTPMPAAQVTKLTRVKPDHIYVIPPNRTINMTDTHLDTAEFNEPRGRRTPIDIFFRSLASETREPIAIILSGGGTDGSVGVKDIKEVGGLIMVQQPEDAEYDSMPRAALSTGLADVVLPAGQLAVKLSEYGRHRPKLPHDAGQLSEADIETLQRILAQVHARTGHDFSQYKRSTILRRIERRMQLNGLGTLEAYLSYLRTNPDEAYALFNDILIGVTNFFRDRASWETLEKSVLPELFKNRGEDQTLRVWTIGCATGEEAYGLAILLFEEAERQSIYSQVQVFATDLDERSIADAREGLYPAAIEADVSPERLARFFVREGDYYRVKRELRDVVLFTSHNVMRDPPFSRQDLIACRNVLIYLQQDVQAKLFDIFHYSLQPGGYLFLGSSESVEHLPDLFDTLDKTHRIYQSKPWPGNQPHLPHLPLTFRRRPRPMEVDVPDRPRPRRHGEEFPTFGAQHEKALEIQGPPSVLIDANHMILHVSETAGRYLLQPRGAITGDILRLVRPELQMELRTSILKAFDKDRAIVSRPVLVQFNGHPHRVIVSIRPRNGSTGENRVPEKQALVLFLEHEVDEPIDLAGPEETASAGHAEQESLIVQLQSEIQHLREQLQVTIEEYDSSNEVMKAANEELQSINEEYRSATEELETSKEELQSLNEELQTVNNDLKNKLEEISEAHQELENLLGATEIGTLFLDRGLRIQRFTAGVSEVINILPSDRGRPIGHLTHRLQYDSFMEDAELVLRQLIPVEREVRVEQDGWFLLRFRPFRTARDRIEGVVITFINITALKESEVQLLQAKETLEERVQERTRELDEANQKVRRTRDLFQALFNANPIPTALTRLRDNILLDVNTEFLSYFGIEREQVLGRSLEDLNLGLDLQPGSDETFVEWIKSEGRIRSMEIEIDHPSGEKRHILDSIQYLNLDNTNALISTFIDITERVRAEREIRSLASDLTAAEQEERNRISQILHDDLQQRIFAVKVHLTTLEEAVRKNDLQSVEIDFGQLQDMLADAVSITRSLSIDLSPAILQGDSLVDALNWLGLQMRDQYGLQVHVEANGVSTRFEDTLRILLFQTVREALFNVVKHADTTHATVRFHEAGDQIRLQISDDGKGFDVSMSTLEHSGSGGLSNLRHRLGLMGCTLQVTSLPGKGTEILIHIPVQEVN